MRHHPAYDVTDPAVVRELIQANPWATLVSGTEDGPVASHCPVLLDEDSEELALLTHVGKPDDENHELGRRELMVIFQGRHGYVSPSWYAPGATRAPTWNFSVVHCYGVPELLDAERNLAVLTRLVERFERAVDEPLYLEPEFGAQAAAGTVGIRVPVNRFVCKRKLSQDKDPISRRQAIAALRAPGPYHHPELADEMERELETEG
jgi:transcriptional regulator